MSNDDTPDPQNQQPPGTVDSQVAALTELVGTLTNQLHQLEARVHRLAKAVADRDHASADDDTDDPTAPAAWVWFPPPAASHDATGTDPDPRQTVQNFVHWYNHTYVGPPGTRAQPIPPCWYAHPGLAMEVANLAYTWRAANISPTATTRDAQYWHHTWRPGFADRLAGNEWITDQCRDIEHKATGAAARTDRFTCEEQDSASGG